MQGRFTTLVLMVCAGAVVAWWAISTLRSNDRADTAVQSAPVEGDSTEAIAPRAPCGPRAQAVRPTGPAAPATEVSMARGSVDDLHPPDSFGKPTSAAAKPQHDETPSALSMSEAPLTEDPSK